MNTGSIIRDLPQQHPLAQEQGVWVPSLTRTDYSWGLFRCTLDLDEPIDQATLWWSGSQRCTLWLNGELLADGPPRSDRETWGYVSTALPPLKEGTHCLAVEVHHAGKHAGKGQIGGPAFWVSQTDHPQLAPWGSTHGNWRCLNDISRTVHIPANNLKAKGHRAVGKGQTFLADTYPWDWQQHDFDDSDWQQPQRIPEAHGNPWGNRSLGCHLVEHDMPAIPRTVAKWQRLWLNGSETASQTTWTISEPTRIICDVGAVCIGYPSLSWRKGSRCDISITACEAPIDNERNKVERSNPLAGNLPGLVDHIHIDKGIEHTRNWQPEWIRALRYLVIDIEPRGHALEFDLPRWQMATYPLQEQSQITLPDSPQRRWSQLIKVNRQTAASCAHETFFDCPAWEQAQFPGDARIQARHHYIVGNDDRLALKAMRDCAASMSPSGLLRSHWPSAFEQIIATYSLQWIGMLHDHYRHFNRPSAWSDLLPTARGIIAWFANRTRSDGLLGHIAEATFIDWAFTAGCPPQDPEGGSALLTALVAESATMLADLEQVGGYPELASRWQEQANTWKAGVQQCWDQDKNLYRDTLNGSSFSTHTQVQAVLANCIHADEGAELLQRAIADDTVQQPFTLYYRAHLAQAWRQCGQASKVVKLLDDWFQLLAIGISTWPENDSPQARSDCHAWGCMPESEIVHSLFGIEMEKPGWAAIRLQPHWDSLSANSRCELSLASGYFAFSYDEQDGSHKWRLSTPVKCKLWNGEILPPGDHSGVRS